jgi:putative addiction module component (TIGR02574 family)
LAGVSKAEIIAGLTKLSPRERGEILEQLWRLEEAAGPTATEKALLNEAQADYEAHPGASSPWSEVEARLRKKK